MSGDGSVVWFETASDLQLLASNPPPDRTPTWPCSCLDYCIPQAA